MIAVLVSPLMCQFVKMSPAIKTKLQFLFSSPLLNLPLPGNAPLEFSTARAGYSAPSRVYTPPSDNVSKEDLKRPRWVSLNAALGISINPPAVLLSGMTGFVCSLLLSDLLHLDTICDPVFKQITCAWNWKCVAISKTALRLLLLIDLYVQPTTAGNQSWYFIKFDFLNLTCLTHWLLKKKKRKKKRKKSLINSLIGWIACFFCLWNDFVFCVLLWQCCTVSVHWVLWWQCCTVSVHWVSWWQCSTVSVRWVSSWLRAASGCEICGVTMATTTDDTSWCIPGTPGQSVWCSASAGKFPAADKVWTCCLPFPQSFGACRLSVVFLYYIAEVFYKLPIY